MRIVQPRTGRRNPPGSGVATSSGRRREGAGIRRSAALLLAGLLVGCAGGETEQPLEAGPEPVPAIPSAPAAGPLAPSQAAADAGTADVDWVRIPGGVVPMGTHGGPADERPVHESTVPAFEISRTPVTVLQYRGCVDAGACAAPDVAPGECNWEKQGREKHPVNCVTWSQSVAFAAWAGGRLPTESEWVRAARGGEDHPYAGSADLDEVACWNRYETGEGTCAVASFRPNGYGLYDMTGNVWEWIADCYEPTYRGAPTDGSARTECDGDRRVRRGGTWSGHAPELMRIADRDQHAPEDPSCNGGFRVARDVPTGGG